MKKFLLFMTLLATLSGCAAGGRLVWTSDNGGYISQEQFKKDNFECSMQSRTQWGGGGSGLIGVAMIMISQAQAQAEANRIYKTCMEIRGYKATYPDGEGEK